MINLISNSREVRQALYTKMSALYSARNAIVHGLAKKDKFYICIDNLGNYEEIVRKTISVFIDTMKSENLNFENMMNKLDYDKQDIYDIDMTNMSWKE